MVRVHGVIHLEVIEARDLPNMDFNWWGRSKNVSDPCAEVELIRNNRPIQRIAKTRMIENNLSPKWYEKFIVNVCHEQVDDICFTLYDIDPTQREFMCSVTISATQLSGGNLISGWYSLHRKNGKAAGEIKFSLRLSDVTTINSSSFEVPDVCFPMRKGCSVRLYQDAHTPAVPPVTDVVCANGQHYNPPQLWVEMAQAMKNAQKLIYILGWSLKADVELERKPDGKRETLSDILIAKAASGVRVLVMLWDDASSTGLNSKGMMNVHDEETKQHFKGTGVEVVLAPRQKRGGGLKGQFFTFTMYTHHQKCVIVDAHHETDPLRRRLVAFVGGVDLTSGRWDTPSHDLFATLESEHKHDFYNKACKTTVEQGPRQPWHDIHMFVEGKAAHDVVMNFIERWKRQAPGLELRLMPLDEREFDLQWSCNDTVRSWNVQLFRSINSDSAVFDIHTSASLQGRNGRQIDNSIQRAYIHHIRRAKRFIYVENQYFLGSSTEWSKPNNNAPHLIPLELTARIVRAIRSGEEFKAYILIPLHSEGDPKGKATQEILRWQRYTMEMMYVKIATAIREKEVKAHPTDYLCFFCLGKRESPETLPNGLKDPAKKSVALKVRQSLRFMIYVHSKMAIFDDEYIIVGSANINERSMDGNRDTEMCLGAYQPSFTMGMCGDADVAGDVRDFRLALWAEHCGEHMEEHLRPGSSTCMAKMKALGQINLDRYISSVVDENKSHLMVYPLSVSLDGDVRKRPDVKEFPDTGGLIFGSSNPFPDRITT